MAIGALLGTALGGLASYGISKATGGSSKQNNLAALGGGLAGFGATGGLSGATGLSGASVADAGGSIGDLVQGGAGTLTNPLVKQGLGSQIGSALSNISGDQYLQGLGLAEKLYTGNKNSKLAQAEIDRQKANDAFNKSRVIGMDSSVGQGFADSGLASYGA